MGITFDVSLFLNTENQFVNAIKAVLKFSPEKLQLVSPSSGKSLVSVWTGQPKYDNRIGRVELQGGIPGGVNVEGGLIGTFTFRVRGVGVSMVKLLDGESQVLLNDGAGTDSLTNTKGGIYNLVLPPPAGPTVYSETHPDQSKFYASKNVSLRWNSTGDEEGYSYIISNNPIGIPDDTSEDAKNFVVYRNLGDGTHYFHIKTLRNGLWGGTTHFAVNIDTLPPAEFFVEIIPGATTVRNQPIIQFNTTDALSGLDYYELKIIPLSPGGGNNGPLFIVVDSPYVPSTALEIGSYDVIVRAYDKIGNYREEVRRLKIINVMMQWIPGRGLNIGSKFIIPPFWFWIIGVALILGLGFLAWFVKKWHDRSHLKLTRGELPDDIRQKLEELNHYRQKYGGVLMLLLLLGASFIMAKSVLAQRAELAPPFIATISKNISNDEIFYVGGKTDASNVKVIIYLQNLQTGETLSQETVSDNRGDWFYRHPTFLASGTYFLWTQAKLIEETNPPSPQIQLTVQPTAIQFGASRLSYETLYEIIAIVFLLIILILVAYILHHAYHGRRKNEKFWKEVREAEESIRRGFAVLRRDIEAELALVKKAKLGKELSLEEKGREERLLKDLDWVQKYIGKEVWDIERTGH